MASAKSSHTPTPVILCGKTEQIGGGVIAGLKPEYEVVQFITSPEACIAEIPMILRGQKPETSSSSIGSGNITADRRPVAVILGAGFAETFDQVHDSVEAAFEDKTSGVAWLRHDGTKPAPPLGPEYGKAVLKRAKDTMADLAEGGKLGTGESGVYLY